MDRGPAQVGVEEHDVVTNGRERHRESDGDGGFPFAGDERRDGDDVGTFAASVSSTAVRNWRNDSSSSGIDFDVIQRSQRPLGERVHAVDRREHGEVQAGALRWSGRGRVRVRDATSATKTAASTPSTAEARSSAVRSLPVARWRGSRVR